MIKLEPGGADHLRARTSWLTLLVAVAVLLIKFGAFALTGSLALLSDAAESIVNVVAGIAVLLSVRWAQQPPDYEHPYGHHKAEYLSGALEGSLIFVAALTILFTAVPRLFAPPELEHLGIGVLVAGLAAGINLVLARYLQRVATRTESMALEANARHLLTDVYTSLGVVLAVGLVALTGWRILDPLLACAVALNIIYEGWQVLTASVSDLLDTRLPEADEAVILKVLDAHAWVLGYHRLRSRRSGRTRFAEVDVFVDPKLTVNEAHRLVAKLEDDIIRKLPGLVTTIHIEPYLEGRREGAVPPREEFSN